MSLPIYDKNNIFAKIIEGDVPAKKVYEDEKLIAFHDIAPLAPIHVLVIPKAHYVDYSDFVLNASAEEIRHYYTTIPHIVKLLNLEEDGFRLCTNRGAKSGQSVFHFHTHILGGSQFLNLC